MDLLNGLTPVVAQFSAQLPSLVTTLTNAGLTAEAQLVQGFHATVSDAISQAQDAIAVDLKPLVGESQAWYGLISKLLTSGIVGTVGGIPITLKSQTEEKT